MSWLSHGIGTNKINQNFDYDPALSNVSGTNSMLNEAIGNVSQMGDNLSTQAGQTFNYGQSFLNPNSDYYKTQRNFLTEDLTQSINEQNRNANQMLASRGINTGGIRNMLGAVNNNSIGENVRKGFSDLYKQGVSTGTSLLSAGMSGMSGAGNLYQGAGNMAGSIQDRLLTQALANAQAQNEQSQFTATSNYNQALGNRQNKADFTNNLIGSAAQLISPFKIF